MKESRRGKLAGRWNDARVASGSIGLDIAKYLAVWVPWKVNSVAIARVRIIMPASNCPWNPRRNATVTTTKWTRSHAIRVKEKELQPTGISAKQEGRTEKKKKCSQYLIYRTSSIVFGLPPIPKLYIPYANEILKKQT